MEQPNGIEGLAPHQQLRAIRQEAGIPAGALAKRLGLTPTTLNARELGRRRLYPDEVHRCLLAMLAIDKSRAAHLGVAGHRCKNGRSLRALRRRLRLSCEDVAYYLEQDPVALGRRERDPGDWFAEDRAQYVNALKGLADYRTLRLKERVEWVIGHLPNDPVPPAYQRRRYPPRAEVDAEAIAA